MSTVTDTSSTPTAVAGRYDLMEGIGSGGAASVYRARDRVLGRDVAVKVFHAESVAADDLVRQEREIRMLSTLSHPGLISVYDAGRHAFEGTVRRFLVMELVSHASLERRLREAGTLPPHEVASIGAQIADALDHVHSCGVLHRDVKPANILISDAGGSGFRRIAKLGDFGIAHYLEGRRLTSDGTILGTAAYLSPEQVRGTDVGTASDVYSLGLVLLEALTGVQEFPGTVVESAVARTTRDPHVPQELADEWRVLLEAMTSRRPEERPAARDVAAILHGRPSRELTGTGRRSAAAGAPLRSSRSERVMIAGAIGLVAVVGALCFTLGYLVGG